MEDRDSDTGEVSKWRLNATIQMQRAFAYWGIVKHPYGREYARQHFTPFGGRREP